jgi:hypothetical protein
MSRRTTDLQLERYLAHALGTADKAQLEATLAASPDDQAALQALRADTAALFTALPPPAFAHKLAPEPRPRRWAWLAGLLATGFAASLALVLLRPPPVGDDDDLRTKGGHLWRVTVTRKGALLGGVKDQPLREGDVLSFTVVSAEPGYAAVLSHAPDGFQVYAPYEPVRRGETVLHQAAELDAARGSEVLYLLVSAQEFDVEQARQAFEANPSLTEWNGVHVEQRPFVKE